MADFDFAYVGIVGGILGLLIGSIFGPVGALTGILAGMTSSAVYWKNKTRTSQKIAEIEQRVDELEGKIERNRDDK